MTEVRMSTNPKRRPTPGNQPSVRRNMPSVGYWLFSLAIVAIVMTIHTTVYLSGSDDGMLLEFDAEEVKEESLGSSSDSGDGKGISDEAIWSKFDAEEVEEPQLDSVDKRSRTYSVAEFYKTDDDLTGLDEDDDIVDDDNDYSSADDLQESHEDSQIIETTGIEITEPSTKDENTTETTEPSTKDKNTTEITEPSTKDGNCDKFKEGDTSPLENVDSIFNCGSVSGKCHWFYPGKFLHASCGIGKEFTPQVNRMKYLYKKDNLWIAGPPIVLPTAKIVPENMRINPFREGPWPRHNLSMIHVHKTGGTSLVLAFDGVLRKGAMGKRRTLYFPRKKTKRITQQQRKESKEKRLSEGSRFLDNAVKYRQQWKENEHTIFAVVRDPVDRFISAIGQATGALGSTTNGVGKNLLDECLKETSKETLNCFINLVHTNSTWLEVHFTPMLLEIAFATVYKDIPVAIFPFEEVPSLMVELGSNPKSKKKDGSATNYRKSEVLTSMSVEDYDEEINEKLFPATQSASWKLSHLLAPTVMLMSHNNQKDSETPQNDYECFNMDVASESIYNLIPKPKQEACKKRIYRSKYDPKAPLSGSTFGLHGTTVTVGKGINELKKTCVISSTFGPTQMKPDPSKFLRRKSQNLPKTGKCFRRAPVGQKPPVPSCDDKPIMGLRSSKNYIVSNATQAIIQEPKGLKEEEKSFLKKETYGKVPEYLKKVKKEVQREKEVVEFCVKEKANEPEEEEYIMFDEMERQHLIYSLKRKWDDVNSTYQKICHRVSINSLGDIKRKEAQEAELQQLEDDIQRLSRPGPLYIKKS